MTTRDCVEFILLLLFLGFLLPATNAGKRNLDVIHIVLAVASAVVLFVYAIN